MTSLAVLFDMDGVLVDSYKAHYESWRLLAGEQGCEFTEEDFAHTFGMTSREILSGHWPAEVADDQIAPADVRKEQLYREIIAADFPAMDGAADLVRSLSEAGFALAVGSSGPRANIDVVLDQLGAGDCFGAIVSGQDVQRGKPDPQVFQLAAKALGIPADRCVVVEDAVAGVVAGKRAGMKVIALTGTATREELALADRVVDRLDELTPAGIADLIC